VYQTSVTFVERVRSTTELEQCPWSRTQKSPLAA